MRILFISCLIVLTSSLASSQDRLVKISGDTIDVKMISEDDSLIYFNVYKKNRPTKTYLDKGLVDTLIYDSRYIIEYIASGNDTITTKSGQKLAGKIISQAEKNVVFKRRVDGKSKTTRIRKENIEAIQEGKEELRYLKMKDVISFGAGLGVDYAIQGANLLVYAGDLGFFVGMGTGDSRAEDGGNHFVGGLRFRSENPYSNTLVNGYGTVMYGPNLVEGDEQKYGISAGGGIDIFFSRKYAHYVTIGMNLLFFKEPKEDYYFSKEEKLSVAPRLALGLRLPLHARHH
ncbi:hypothetical protein [Reichenbachiella sp.]|uniref:hypothetical protein n=1 Tax=Reichenbachiella sp. TaxID=2184521 RepID=UPI003BB1D4EE